eukprot:778142_1
MKKPSRKLYTAEVRQQRHAVCYTAKSEPYNRWNVYTYYIYNLLDARHSLFTCHQFNICAVPRSAIDPIQPLDRRLQCMFQTILLHYTWYLFYIVSFLVCIR